MAPRGPIELAPPVERAFLLGLLAAFAVYWGLAGPGSYWGLRSMSRTQFAWLAFVAVAAGAIMPGVSTNISQIFSKISSSMGSAAITTMAAMTVLQMLMSPPDVLREANAHRAIPHCREHLWKRTKRKPRLRRGRGGKGGRARTTLGGRHSKKPRHPQPSPQAGEFDAVAQLAAEAEGGTRAQNRQGAGNLVRCLFVHVGDAIHDTAAVAERARLTRKLFT